MNASLRYEFFDVDRDAQARAFVRALGSGRLTIPIVLVGDDVLTGPTIPELQDVLHAHAFGSQVRRRRHVGVTT